MVNFTVEELRAQMDDARMIRNMSVIAHVDHGKSTLTDSLIAAAGIISQGRAGLARFTDTRADEQERCITIKSTGVSLYYECDPEGGDDKKGYLINLIDSPGHVDFSSEVTAALRVTDGSLVVVDCIQGVSVQTETVLRQSLEERVVPVLMLNKLDRILLELHMEPEEAYQAFARVIENVNALLSIYSDKTLACLADYQVDPVKGNVAFGAGLQAWGFTLTHFAHMYARGDKAKAAVLAKRLWGEHYINPKTGKWSKKAVDANGTPLVRGFCQYIMGPIMQLTKTIKEDRLEDAYAMLTKLGVNITKEEKDLRGKELIRVAMQRWLPAADALLEMIVLHLPSPVTAQEYRFDHLYEGPLDDECAMAIKKCDRNGPLMLFISKMIPTGDGSRFIAFGRVFSGVVATGQRVRIMGSEYKAGGKKDLHIRNIQRTVIMMGGSVDSVEDIPCGNTCGLVGVDQFILKTATISNSEVACTIKQMKFSVSPVVRVAVNVANTSDLPKLLEGLKRLSKSDPCVQCTSDNNEHVIAGAGELHLEICLKDLEEDYCKCKIVQSTPVVAYTETVTAESDHQIAVKSGNKHNRFFLTAEPFPEGDDEHNLVDEIEGKVVEPSQDPKERAKYLETTYGMDRNDVSHIWAFGPLGDGPNLLLNVTSGVQYLTDVKDHCNNGFQMAVTNGPLGDEPVRGVIIKIHDAKLHADSIHRSGAQITPTFKRGCTAAMLCASPRFYEPMFMVDISAPEDCIGGVYSVLSNRRGQVQDDIPREGTPMHNIRAFLPVAESFGFDRHLRSETSGRAFPQCSFSHWELVTSDPLTEGSPAHAIMMGARKRKGMKEIIPNAVDLEDRV